jgi:hypothetical protein
MVFDPIAARRKYFELTVGLIGGEKTHFNGTSGVVMGQNVGIIAGFCDEKEVCLVIFLEDE